MIGHCFSVYYVLYTTFSSCSWNHKIPKTWIFLIEYQYIYCTNYVKTSSNVMSTISRYVRIKLILYPLCTQDGELYTSILSAMYHTLSKCYKYVTGDSQSQLGNIETTHCSSTSENGGSFLVPERSASDRIAASEAVERLCDRNTRPNQSIPIIRFDNRWTKVYEGTTTKL